MVTAQLNKRLYQKTGAIIIVAMKNGVRDIIRIVHVKKACFKQNFVFVPNLFIVVVF